MVPVVKPVSSTHFVNPLRTEDTYPSVPSTVSLQRWSRTDEGGTEMNWRWTLGPAGQVDIFSWTALLSPSARISWNANRPAPSLSVLFSIYMTPFSTEKWVSGTRSGCSMCSSPSLGSGQASGPHLPTLGPSSPKEQAARTPVSAFNTVLPMELHAVERMHCPCEGKNEHGERTTNLSC